MAIRQNIASALGLKENTVDQKVRRGLEKLRKALEGGDFMKDVFDYLEEEDLLRNLPEALPQMEDEIAGKAN